MPRIAPLVVFALVVLAGGGTARAQDAFEIQVYDSGTAPPGGVGVEMHFNTVIVGDKQGEAPELATHHVSHLTLEPHVGIAEWCEAGAYIQTAIRPDGGYDFAGLKLRFKARWPRKLAGIVGLALNGELSSIPQEYEPHRFGSEIRPIIDFTWKRLYAAVNPIVSIDLAGSHAGHPQLEPAAKLSVRAAKWLALGAEYYGAYGPVDHFDARDQQSNRLFGALDFDHDWGPFKLAVNAGAGYDFTGPDKVIAKLIVGFDYEREK